MLKPLILNTLAQAGTDTGKDVLIKLFLFFVVAVIFFSLGYLSQQRKRGKGKWLKFVFGLLPVAAAVIFTMDYFRYANDGFNIKATGMNVSQIGLYKFAPFIALIFGILLLGLGIFLDRKADNRAEDIL